MKPLREDEARTLFFSRFPSDQSGNCDQSVLFDIVRKCGGFPLATATISSLLARSLIEQCNCIRRSLSSNLRTNPSIEGMKQVLNLCYNNLPCHLKACMLYISLYKEDHIIWKDDLVKQWIAEGFICAKEGETMEKVASAYFDELVNRGLIQPEDINCSGEVLSCTVHYMILNLIRYKSVEENFVTAIDCTQTNIRLADKVRRLSLLFGDADDAEQPANLRLSNIRSLVFDGPFKTLPSIVEFRHLRVLILHIWGDQDNISFDLTTLRELFGLRYLQMVCDVTLNLRTDMHGLKYLETLKIDSRVMEVPQDIIHLPGLLHLSLPGGTRLPGGIEQLATLQTFGCFDLSSNSPETVRSLGELTHIWDLRLTCSEPQSYNLKKNMDQLSSVISNLRNLKSLTLLLASVSSKENTLEGSTASSTDITFVLSNVSSPPLLLEKFELMPRICILSVLPEWIGELRLLSILKIEVMGLSGGDIGILKGLPALTALSLYVRTAPAERIIFHKDGFPILKHLMFICPALCVAFAQGAMPNVRRLKLGFNANTIGECSIVEAGFENLAVLESLSAQIGGAEFCAHEFSRKSVQSALEDTFRQSRSPPVVDVQLVDWVFYGHKEIGTSSAARQQTAEEPSTEDIITLLPHEGDDPDTDLHQRHRTPRPPSPPPSPPTGQDAQPRPHRRPRGCGGSMLLGPLSSGCGGVLSTSKSEGRDGLLWWHGLAPCHGGRVSVAVAQANNLLEDHCCIESSYDFGTLVGVFDGHGGIEAVRFAFDHLLLYLKLAYSSLFSIHKHQDRTTDAIRKAFEDTEGGFLDLVSQRWEKEPRIATVGTCCLVGVVWLGTLFVANLGNSRAVLGKMGTTGKITAQQLSNDHDVSQVAVRKELISQHPDDPRIVVLKQGVWTVKGLEFMSISRSIGDAYLKHAKYNSERIHSRFRLAEPITKPLLTADPDIICHQLQASDRFVIFASHGLWEHLSNQEAVDIVHRHPPAGSARRLIKAALKEAARRREMPYSDLKKIDRGVRRHFHDDITVIVLFIDSSKGQELTIRYPHTW